jgi:hypothetical protein
MLDKADAALAVSTAALVVGVYSAAMPTMAETRAQYDDHGHLRASNQYATIVAGVSVLALAALTRSASVAVIGVVAVVGMSSAFHTATITRPNEH